MEDFSVASQNLSHCAPCAKKRGDKWRVEIQEGHSLKKSFSGTSVMVWLKSHIEKSPNSIGFHCFLTRRMVNLIDLHLDLPTSLGNEKHTILYYISLYSFRARFQREKNWLHVDNHQRQFDSLQIRWLLKLHFIFKYVFASWICSKKL